MSNVLTIPTSGTIIFSSDAAGTFNVSPLSASPRITYDNAGGLNITSYTTASSALNRFAVDGAAGRLFSVSDALTGTIFTVNDISGLPIIKVDSNILDVITMGAPNTNTFVISNTSVGIGTTTPNERLTVVGNISASGIIYGNGSGLTNIGSSGGAYLPLSGGTLTGGLTANNNIIVLGSLSAAQYLGLPASYTGAYLPLSGGTLTGGLTANNNVIVLGTLSASQYLGLPASFTGAYLPLSGGTLTGGLTANNNVIVLGTLSASQYLGLPASYTGAYLPLSGGTLTGSLTANNNIIVLGSLSAVQYLGLPASYTGAYLPLSGGGIVTGATSFQGILSSTSVVYASGGNSDVWNSTTTTVQTFSASWGQGGTVNPIPLITSFFY